MKKYITIAALLAAGSAFANAETFTWNSTDGEFSGFKTEQEDIVTIMGDFSLEFVVQATERDGDFKVMFGAENGTEIGLSEFHGPGNFSLYWVKQTPGEPQHLSDFGGHFSDVRIVDSPATFKFDFTETSNGYYDVVIVVSNETASWTNSWSYSGFNISGRENGEQAPIQWTSLTIADATVSSVKLTASSFIPEPSAFGMLAGLGALALVASRRRRK